MKNRKNEGHSVTEIISSMLNSASRETADSVSDAPSWEPKQSPHELNIDDLGRVNRAIAALIDVYGDAPKTPKEREEIESDEEIRAWSVLDDLRREQDELIEDILAVDPQFRADHQEPPQE
jgi:hypothetical protein